MEIIIMLTCLYLPGLGSSLDTYHLASSKSTEGLHVTYAEHQLGWCRKCEGQVSSPLQLINTSRYSLYNGDIHFEA